MNDSNLKKKLLIGLACFLLVMLVVFGLNSTSTDNAGEDTASEVSTSISSEVAAGQEIKYTSSDGAVTGEIRVAEAFSDGKTAFDFAFVINDTSPNNGFCQSNDAEYCDRESSKAIEEIKYRYGVTFASTENSEDLIATVYEPIYCNLEAAKADPLNIGYNKTDISCDGWMAPNWKPTEWFVAKNRASTSNFETLSSGLTLKIYDIASEFIVEVEDGGATVTSGRLDYDQITGNKLVNTFELLPVSD